MTRPIKAIPIRIMLKDQTAKLVHGGARTIVTPWKEQPPKNYELWGNTWLPDGGHEGEYMFYNRIHDDYKNWYAKPPYKVGDTLYLLETWISSPYGYSYKANGGNAGGMLGEGANYWRSPTTMQTRDMETSPCRHIVRCTSIEGVRFDSLMEYKIGDFKNYIHRFKERFAMNNKEMFMRYFTETFDLPFDSRVWLTGFGREEND